MFIIRPAIINPVNDIINGRIFLCEKTAKIIIPATQINDSASTEYLLLTDRTIKIPVQNLLIIPPDKQ